MTQPTENEVLRAQNAELTEENKFLRERVLHIRIALESAVRQSQQLAAKQIGSENEHV